MTVGVDGPIVCSRCRVPIEASASFGCEPVVRCPVCGQTDTLDSARREACQHTAQALLSRMLGRPTDKPESSFRFVEGRAGYTRHGALI